MADADVDNTLGGRPLDPRGAELNSGYPLSTEARIIRARQSRLEAKCENEGKFEFCNNCNTRGIMRVREDEIKCPRYIPENKSPLAGVKCAIYFKSR